VIEELLKEAYKLATPSEEEEQKVREVAHRAKTLVGEAVRMSGVDAVVDVYGSAARSTWLPGQRDVDVFVVVNTALRLRWRGSLDT
jgi:tRNA nucleotidyltransferase (CCA-adding enzyme)